MAKYTLTIEGDFEKGECEKCSVRYFTFNKYGEREEFCPAHISECPLKEVKQGEWKYNAFYDCWDCSICGHSMGDQENFCSNCGADMRGDKE